MANLLKVGDVMKCTKSYGGNSYTLGLFAITSIGNKFVMLKSIKCEQIRLEQDYSDPAYREKITERKAIIPHSFYTADEYKDKNKELKGKFSLNLYDPESCSAIISDGGALCTKTYEIINPNENGDYVYKSVFVNFG